MSDTQAASAGDGPAVDEAEGKARERDTLDIGDSP
jgi:hypothetical protein